MSEFVADERLGRRCRIGFAIALAVGSIANVAVATMSIMGPDMLYAATGQQSKFEKELEAALRDSLEVDMHVRCTDNLPEGVAANVGMDGNYMRIRPKYCDALEELSTRDELYVYGQALDLAARSTLHAAHEGQHVAQDSTYESEVQCYAVQTAPAVAEQLGASPQVARQIGEYIIYNVDEWHPPLENGEPNEYYVPDECYDGSSLDLSPGPGYFPPR